MKLGHILAMTWARSLEFLRDRSALGWNLALPLLMVGGFAWIFSGPGRPLFTVAVLSDAAVQESLPAAPGVRFYAETDAVLARGKVARHRIDLAIDLRSQPARYYLNPEAEKGRAVEAILKSGGLLSAAERAEESGDGIRYVDWAAPGVLGMNLMFSCLFGTGYVIVRYRKSGYLKRLKATPLSAAEFIVAQLLSRLLLVLAVTVVVYLACAALLDLRQAGSAWTLLLVTAVGSYSMVALGLVVAARVTSEELAGGTLNLLSWPMMVLSGVFFAIDGAPPAVQWLAQWLPLTALLDAARAIMLDGAGLADAAVLKPLALLGGMSVLFTLLGALGFRWTQD